MRLGIFGGSFDPVHKGHLELARACQAKALLDEVWFTPTAIQPLKRNGPQASDADRVEMLRLAIDSAESEPGCHHPRQDWRVCTMEIDRGGFSYTVDTLRQIHEELPDVKLFFLIGADAIADVPRWKEPREIFRLATPLVVARAGEPEPELSAIAGLCTRDNKPIAVHMQPVNVSSREIRQSVAGGASIEDMVPHDVARYIEVKSLYRGEEHRP